MNLKKDLKNSGITSVPYATTCAQVTGRNAKIAQLVERHLAKVEVAGSSPVFRSKGN